MQNGGDDGLRVSYGIKELLGRIDLRLENISAKLDGKVDTRDFEILEGRVASLERRTERQEDQVRQKGLSWSRKEKLAALIIAALAVLAQVLPFVYGGHP